MKIWLKLWKGTLQWRNGGLHAPLKSVNAESRFWRTTSAGRVVFDIGLSESESKSNPLELESTTCVAYYQKHTSSFFSQSITESIATMASLSVSLPKYLSHIPTRHTDYLHDLYVVPRDLSLMKQGSVRELRIVRSSNQTELLIG